MSPRLIRWCAHPTRHINCTKIGYKTTHPKGKRIVKNKLAYYIQTQYRRSIGSTKVTIKEGDYLCTSCYELENNKMNKKYGILQASETDVGETILDTRVQFSVNSNEDLFDEEIEVSSNQSPLNTPTKYMNSQSETFNVLNAVFDLLKIDRIIDVYVHY